MTLTLSVILAIVGLFVVIYFAEKLVKGAVGTSSGFGISAFVVSVIFIGFDPENLAVGAVGSVEGVPGIALGSIIGAAMVAIALAFGVTALIVPMEFKKTPRSILAIPIVSVLLFGGLAWDGLLSRFDGGILLAAFCLAVVALLWMSRRGIDIEPEGEVAETLEEAGRLSKWKALGMLLLSLLAIVVGSEQAKLNAWIYVDVATSDIGGYVAKARDLIQNTVINQPDFPTGYNVIWSGQYEYMQEANQRLMFVVPITLVVIVFLLYIGTGSSFRTMVILLAVPFSLVGAIWFLYLLGYHLSLAVWVGLIALAGLDAETGAVMLLYLDISYDKFHRQGLLRSLHDLELAIHDGAVKRIRPKTMTVMAALFGLVPIMIGSETGADTMKRLAAPMIGGLVTSFIMELFIYPVIFYFHKRREVRRLMQNAAADQAAAT